ncbi:MAG TPA: hypothetical protein ENN77_01865 [Candidatus Wirthbacteria bacterium]|nr:hypothetical protein [Candidatus Wirthbacteria bacterium]
MLKRLFVSDEQSGGFEEDPIYLLYRKISERVFDLYRANALHDIDLIKLCLKAGVQTRTDFSKGLVKNNQEAADHIKCPQCKILILASLGKCPFCETDLNARHPAPKRDYEPVSKPEDCSTKYQNHSANPSATSKEQKIVINHRRADLPQIKQEIKKITASQKVTVPIAVRSSLTSSQHSLPVRGDAKKLVLKKEKSNQLKEAITPRVITADSLASAPKIVKLKEIDESPSEHRQIRQNMRPRLRFE